MIVTLHFYSGRYSWSISYKLAEVLNFGEGMHLGGALDERFLIVDHCISIDSSPPGYPILLLKVVSAKLRLAE